jgi:hypothetical protein
MRPRMLLALPLILGCFATRARAGDLLIRTESQRGQVEALREFVNGKGEIETADSNVLNGTPRPMRMHGSDVNGAFLWLSDPGPIDLPGVATRKRNENLGSVEFQGDSRTESPGLTLSAPSSMPRMKVPEPSSVTMSSIGVILLACWRRIAGRSHR